MSRIHTDRMPVAEGATFFDFEVPGHWPLFAENIRCLEERRPKVLDAFLSRSALTVWAQRLGMERIYLGCPDGGQSRCVMKKGGTAA